MKTIAFYSLKGGVGKSTGAVNVAWGAAKKGKKTILIDLDAQGAASYYLGARPNKKLSMLDLLPKKSKLGKALKETDNDNLMVLPAGKGLRKLDVHMDEEDLSFDRLMKALEKKKFDLVVFDCPPQIGVLGEHILDTADRIIVPIVPTPLSTRTYDMIREFADKRKFPKKKIHGYWSMVRSRLKIHKETMENYGKKHKEIFQTFLPVSADIERMSENKKPLLEMRYSLPARQKMQALMDEMYQAGILK